MHLKPYLVRYMMAACVAVGAIHTAIIISLSLDSDGFAHRHIWLCRSFEYFPITLGSLISGNPSQPNQIGHYMGLVLQGVLVGLVMSTVHWLWRKCTPQQIERGGSISS
jgi:hypothetical protein